MSDQKISKSDAEKVIKSGGSVIWEGRVVSTIEGLSESPEDQGAAPKYEKPTDESQDTGSVQADTKAKKK